MRSFSRNFILGCGATVLMCGASEPVFGRDWHNQPYSGDYRENRAGVSPAEGRQTFIQTLADLNRVISDYNLPGWERARLAQARRDMFEFRDHFVRDGRFDLHELGESIGTIETVVRNAPMNPQDRDALTHDVHELRELSGGVSFDHQNTRREYGYDNQPHPNLQDGNRPYSNQSYRDQQAPNGQGFGYTQGYRRNEYRR